MGAYGKVYVRILLVCIVFYVAIGTDFAKATSEDYTTMKIQQGSSLYTVKGEEANKKVLQTMIFPYNTSSLRGFYTIRVGRERYLVKESDVLLGTQKMSSISNKRNITLETKASYTIYAKATSNAPILWKGSTTTTFDVLQNKGAYLIVQIGNKKGYIHRQDFKMKQVKQNYELLEKESLYELTSKKKKKIGALLAGTVVYVTKFDNQYAYLKIGNNAFVIEKSLLLPSERPSSFNKQIAQKYAVTLVSTKAHTVYNKKGIQVGEIPSRQSVELLNIVGDRGLIRFANYTGYVSLTNYRYENLVNGSKSISHNLYEYQLNVLAAMYPKQTKRIKIGESVQGRAIYAFKLGTGKKEIYIDASTHAREHMTTNVVMEMIDTYTAAYVNEKKLYGYDVKKVLDTTSIWFVPMVNPDGVMLVQQGLKSVQTAYKKTVVKANGGSNNFSRYKSNIRGVDLNRNYNVAWKATNSTKTPSYKAYKGRTAVSEPETKAMVRFVKNHSFKTYLTYHSSGQLQYWYYDQSAKQKKKDYALVQKIYNVTKYRPVMSTGIAAGSGAGQDWFVSTFKKPGITIEIAPYVGETTVPHHYWASVWNKNKSVGLLAAKEAGTR